MDFNLTNFSTSKSGDVEQVRVLIIGSGPAGLSAGLYAARADLEPVILTGMVHGGQVSLTYTVENYPGFPDGIGGQEMVELFQKQAERFGARIEFDSATEVDLSQRPFRVKTYNKEYLAESLIIASGATPRHLNVSGENELTGRGVSYCATCDGWFFKEKDVFVVGGGDSALEESIFLTRYANSITVVHRRDELRAGAILQKRAMENPKISYLFDTVVTGIVGKDAVKAVRFKNVKTNEEFERPADGIFIFVGHDPNTQLFKGQLDMDEREYLKVDQLMKTNIPGVFVGGEAGDPHFRQVITSAGMGAAAAMQAGRFLDEHVGYIK
jgi:thioredoxin reductase (NADPH)